MNYFKILGIQPTKDIREIKKAYSALLKVYHPEEFPEQFNELHEAYEKALAYAKREENVISYESDPIDEIRNEEIKETENATLNKFKKIEEKALKYDKEQKEIDDLIQMLKEIKSNNQYVPLSFFDNPLFLKHFKDSRFVNSYTHLIESEDIYKHIPYLKRLTYIQIHEKFYPKEEYSRLHEILKFQLPLHLNIIFEQFILTIAFILIIFSCKETPYTSYLGAELFLYFINLFLLFEWKFPHQKTERWTLRLIVWSIYIIQFILGVTY